MRNTIFVLMLAALVHGLAGCATGFRAGGPESGISAGAAIGPHGDPLPAPPPVRHQ
jgi:hypothetical protein